MKVLPPISDEHFQALAGLVDNGLRAVGLRGAKEAAALLDWMEAAVEAPDEQAEEK